MATGADADAWLRADGADLLLCVRVQPRASRPRLDGIEAGRLRLRVAAPPVEGAANRAVVELLAETLGIARSRLSIERGGHSRSKQVRIAGAAAAHAAIAATLHEACVRKP